MLSRSDEPVLRAIEGCSHQKLQSYNIYLIALAKLLATGKSLKKLERPRGGARTRAPCTVGRLCILGVLETVCSDWPNTDNVVPLFFDIQDGCACQYVQRQAVSQCEPFSLIPPIFNLDFVADNCIEGNPMSPGAFTYTHWRFQVDASMQTVLGCRLRNPRSRWDVNRRFPPLVLVFPAHSIEYIQSWREDPGIRTRYLLLRCILHHRGRCLCLHPSAVVAVE